MRFLFLFFVFIYKYVYILLQPFFPRGPAPRMQNHRNQVVNMQPNNVGQQMFPQHVSFMLRGIFYYSELNIKSVSDSKIA
jgi:hypothetical protein